MSAVLIIDDEVRVRRVARRVLRRAGYEVLEAETGRAGLDLFAAHGSEVAAVLLDVGLADMSGLEVARQLRLDNAEVAVIISSGYDVGEPPEGMRILRKPYGLDELVSAIAGGAVPANDHERRPSTVPPGARTISGIRCAINDD